MKPRRYGPFPYSPVIDRPPLRWPNGARTAVWVIPNIEFFPLDAAMRGEEPVTPNVPAWTRRDYGNRIAVFRMMDMLAKRGIRATVALNSDICTEHPRIIERACELGWELMGHCETNSAPIHKMAPDEERKTIANTAAAIEAATGTRPRGWLGAGLNETWNTLENLAAEGFDYCADWVNDDQPYLMEVGDPALVSMPYSMEINDARAIGRNNYGMGEFGRMIRRQFLTLFEEGARSSNVMGIALHPWITGVPHRIGVLADEIDFIAGHDGVWFATGSEIVDAYVAEIGGRHG